MAVNSLSFPSFEKWSENFISPLLLKDIFANIKFWVNSSFLFSIWKRCYFLLTSMVSDEKSIVIQTVVRIDRYRYISPFVWLLSTFSLWLWFLQVSEVIHVWDSVNFLNLCYLSPNLRYFQSLFQLFFFLFSFFLWHRVSLCCLG